MTPPTIRKTYKIRVTWKDGMAQDLEVQAFAARGAKWLAGKQAKQLRPNHEVRRMVEL